MEKNKKQNPLPLQKNLKGHLLSRSADLSARSRPLRQHLLAGSFVLFVVIPAVLGAVYYALVASDRYVAGAGFAVRGNDASMGSDILSSFTGLTGNGSTTSDSYILLEFLESRDLVEKLEQALPFREIYSTPNADFLTRLDPALDIEHVVEYWQSRIHTSFDNTSGIITFEVEAFTPEDAERVATAVLGFSKDLVNELSAQARRDAVAFAQSEVANAEVRLKSAQEAVRAFREREKSLNPAGAAQIQIELIGELEMQLSDINARIAALKGEVADDSAVMRGLFRQKQALEHQIAEQKENAGTDQQGKALTELLAAYESLEIERGFSQSAYQSALTSLEAARVEAGRQQRYLAVYSVPALAQYPLYPRRFLNIFLIFAGLSLLWGIGTLTVYSVRDHIQ